MRPRTGGLSDRIVQLSSADLVDHASSFASPPGWKNQLLGARYGRFAWGVHGRGVIPGTIVLRKKLFE